MCTRKDAKEECTERERERERELRNLRARGEAVFRCNKRWIFMRAVTAALYTV